jgi:hypothetical protein
LGVFFFVSLVINLLNFTSNNTNNKEMNLISIVNYNIIFIIIVLVTICTLSINAINENKNRPPSQQTAIEDVTSMETNLKNKWNTLAGNLLSELQRDGDLGHEIISLIQWGSMTRKMKKTASSTYRGAKRTATKTSRTVTRTASNAAKTASKAASSTSRTVQKTARSASKAMSNAASSASKAASNAAKTVTKGIETATDKVKEGAEDMKNKMSKLFDTIKADLKKFLIVKSRVSVETYQKMLIDDSEEWEITGYDVRDKMKTIEGFEFMSEKVKAQQRKAFSGIHFFQSCDEEGPKPLIQGKYRNNKHSWKAKWNGIHDTKGCTENLKQCASGHFSHYLELNEDYASNMPLYSADPFNRLSGDPIVAEPCNTAANGAYYMISDVDGVRATSTDPGNFHIQQASANLAFGSFYYHGHGNNIAEAAPRGADVVAMNYLFAHILELFVYRGCNDVQCMNDFYKAYTYPEQVFLKNKEDWGQLGKGMQTKYLTQYFAKVSAEGTTDYNFALNKKSRFYTPNYKESVVGIVYVFLRICFHRGYEGGDDLFEQVSTAVTKALIPDKKGAAAALKIRDEIAKLNLKVVEDVPKAFVIFTEIVRKFLGAMYFQEGKSIKSLKDVFGRYDTCPFMPHSLWHRMSARLLQLMVKGITVDLDTAGFKNELSKSEGTKTLMKLISSIGTIGSATLSVVKVARLELEPKLKDDGLAYQIKVNLGLRAAIAKLVRKKSSVTKKNKSNQHMRSNHRRRSVLSTMLSMEKRSNAGMGKSSEKQLSMTMESKKPVAMKNIMKVKNKKSKPSKEKDEDTKDISGKEEEYDPKKHGKKPLAAHLKVGWNTGYRNICGRGPLSSSNTMYEKGKDFEGGFDEK